MRRFVRIVGMSLLLFTVTFVHGQQRDTIVATDNKRISLPEIGINFGIANLTSDVALQAPGPSPYIQFGFQFTVTQRVAKYLNLSLSIFTGTVYGEENRGLTNLNYRTTLFSQQLNIEYNFYPLLKPDAQGRQLLRPYVGIGGGAMFFRSKGDLKAAGGETYNYWSDGSIKSLDEQHPNAESSEVLVRDMEYESDLRDANLDGLRKYPQTAFSMPFHAGMRVQFSKHFGANVAFTYALNFSDMLDNSGASSIGVRSSSSGNDHHFFGSVGLNFFFGNVRTSYIRTQSPEIIVQSENRWKSKNKLKQDDMVAVSGNDTVNTTRDAESANGSTNGKRKIEQSTSQIDSLNSSNADGGVTRNEETASTSNKSNEGVKIGGDGNGSDSSMTKSSNQTYLAKDKSNLGVKNNASTTEKLTDKQQQPSGAATSVDAKKPAERNAGQLTLTELEKAPPKATGTFYWADRDKNGLVSASEVLFFIDQLFEGDGKLTVEDIQNLIDYYFDQE